MATSIKYKRRMPTPPPDPLAPTEAQRLAQLPAPDPRRLTRAAFDRLTPAEKFATVRNGVLVVDGEA